MGETSASGPRLASIDCTLSPVSARKQIAETAAAQHQWQQRLERQPIFAAAAGGGLARCTLETADDGPTSLRCAFSNGNVLQATQDPRLDLQELTVTFSQPPAAPPLGLLQASEKAVYGQAGCGIGWQKPESRPVTGQPDRSQSIYRGETCHCQAIVQRSAEGRVTALTLKSAC